LVVSTMLEVTLKAPADPAVLDSSVSVDRPLLVTTFAVAPMLAR